MKTIGLFGLTFDSGNMGCCALAYSFAEILSHYRENINIVYLFSPNAVLLKDEITSKIPICVLSASAKSSFRLRQYAQKCDVIFDFTEGDSFSDIYGIKRFLKFSIAKIICIHTSAKFVLGPQTYGPYNSAISKVIAGYIIRNADYICARDRLSAQLASKYRKETVDFFTDVAFALPYDSRSDGNVHKRKVGINVSGLLWRGGYNGNNQFSLRTDYKSYCIKIIEYCLENGYEVHIIPHVITKNVNNIENDYTAACDIKQMYREVMLAPKFTSPIEAKSYISSMDIFIGARMHATIGAFSSGVCTIPFSYSKKFEGLYDSMNYPYVIHGIESDTESSIKQTIAYMENLETLKSTQKSALEYCVKQIEQFKKRVEKILME